MSAAQQTLGTRAWAILSHRAMLTLLVVILVWVVAGFARQGFASYGHLRYLVEIAAVIGLVAAGQTLVVIGGGIDLSVAAIITVSAISLPLLSPAGEPTGLVGLVATLALASFIGFVNGAGIAYLRIHPLIMTLAMATFLQGLLVIIAGGSAVSVDNSIVVWFGSARPAGIPAGIIVWALVSIAVLVYLHRTPGGARIYAIGTNPLAAELSGLRINRVTMKLYAVSGLLSGLAGILILGMNRQGYVGIGDPYLLTSIAAVVLGGTSILGGGGTYFGTIPGSILLVTTTALITVVNASAGWRSILFGSLILILLLFAGRESRR